MGDAPRVGILVPNLFVRVPVESAVRSLGGQPVALRRPGDAATVGCALVLAEVGAISEEEIRSLRETDCAVVVFGPHLQRERLAAARQAGAVALPRSLFLKRLPEILASALGATGRGEEGPSAL